MISADDFDRRRDDPFEHSMVTFIRLPMTHGRTLSIECETVAHVEDVPRIGFTLDDPAVPYSALDGPRVIWCDPEDIIGLIGALVWVHEQLAREAHGARRDRPPQNWGDVDLGSHVWRVAGVERGTSTSARARAQLELFPVDREVTP